jgi:hypothetical protein
LLIPPRETVRGRESLSRGVKNPFPHFYHDHFTFPQHLEELDQDHQGKRLLIPPRETVRGRGSLSRGLKNPFPHFYHDHITFSQRLEELDQDHQGQEFADIYWNRDKIVSRYRAGN